MSLISTIKSKTIEDLLNGGASVIYTGTISGEVSNSALMTLPNERMFVISSIVVSSSSVTPQLVQIGFQTGTASPIEFFSAYVAGSGITKVMVPQDWIYSPLSLTESSGTPALVSLVISAASGGVAYTIQGKIFAQNQPMGSVEQACVNSYRSETMVIRGQSEF